MSRPWGPRKRPAGSGGRGEQGLFGRTGREGGQNGGMRDTAEFPDRDAGVEKK